MSERAPNNIEHGETLLPAGKLEKLLEAHYERSPEELAAEAAKQQEQLETARNVAQTVEQDNPLARLEASEAAAAAQAPVAPPNSFLKKQTLQRELTNVQRQESAPARALSKLIHRPAVQATSEVASRTAGRASGLLGGGIVAFFGGGFYMYYAYHIGFTYQPSVFVALFALGFVLGLAFELISRLFSRS